MRPHSLPQLLISVRSPIEAVVAIAGGCDLLDIKEPNQGSLGAAAPEVVYAICESVATRKSAPPISVALGELAEWNDQRTAAPLPGNVEFVKLGLSGCRHAPAWTNQWQRVRTQVETSSGRPLKWIAVHYADAEADSPEVDNLLATASEAGCFGLLIDTFTKDGRGLPDFSALDSLVALRQQTHSRGLKFAVAGSLRKQNLPILASVSPEIVAVRGAVCRDGDRSAAVSEEAVRAFRQEMLATFLLKSDQSPDTNAEHAIVANSGTGP